MSSEPHLKDVHRSQYRIPMELYRLLKSEADARGVSVNSELVRRIDESLKQDGLVEEVRITIRDELRALLGGRKK